MNLTKVFVIFSGFGIVLLFLYHQSENHFKIHITWLNEVLMNDTSRTSRYLESSPSLNKIVLFPNATSRHLYSRFSSDSKQCGEGQEKNLIHQYLGVTMVCKRTNQSCHVWHWDVANWTLIYTKVEMFVNDSSSSRLCPVPVHGERTAKIVHSNGSIVYPSCTFAYPCSQTMKLFYAYYDNSLKMRINRSPCCRKLLIDITQHMGKVFDKYNVTYFLVGGTVISLVRDNGRFIPYDTDSDVAVDVRDVNKVEKALPELRKPGYIFEWKTEYSSGSKRYMIGCTNKQCLTGPGIAFYSVKDGLVKADVKNWPSFPANFSVPPIRGNFEGVEMSFPKQPENYLNFVYGKDKWKKFMKCTKHYYGQCSE